MHLTQQPIGHRKAAAQSLQAMGHRLDVAGYLRDIPDRHAGCFTELVRQQVIERRLRAFDLRGQNRFFPDVGVEKQMGVG
jgi:hypothetical protein